MNDPEFPTIDFDDDEMHITDLDAPDSLRHRPATRLTRLLSNGLARPWIRSGLASMLVLLLLGALALEWQHTTPPVRPASPLASFALDVVTTPDMIFMQTAPDKLAINNTLMAYKIGSGLRWQIGLPSAATLKVVGQTLYCYFVIPDQPQTASTEIEAIDTNTGRMLWHDILPDAFTFSLNSELPGSNYRGPQGPSFVYQNNVVYVQTTADIIYAIQTDNGQIKWTFQPHSSDQIPYVGIRPAPLTPLKVQSGGVEFIAGDFRMYILSASTGQQIISTQVNFYTFVLPFLYGQILYLWQTPGMPVVRAFHLPDGHLLWTHALDKGAWAQMEADGIIYLGATFGTTVSALRGSDGHLLWSYHASDKQIVTNTYVEQHGIVYLLQKDATLVSLRASDGQILWRTDIAMLKNHILESTTLLIENDTLVIYDQINLSSSSAYVVRAKDGQLLWQSSMPAGQSLLFADALYTIGNTGQIDAWRISDGQHIWSYNNLPAGSNILLNPDATSPLLFFLSPIGFLYILRNSDGKLIIHYP
ncbi:MAG TPA: PQQ-binding-like beta-propeller repeat protein [Ktedonobacteraceae bacterium]